MRGSWIDTLATRRSSSSELRDLLRWYIELVSPVFSLKARRGFFLSSCALVAKAYTAYLKSQAEAETMRKGRERGRNPL